ncbi:MAG: tRNA preQ1(34) S-adenosylmethionine ribosyltransferase-isomerase QueA [Candidatus Omnitrophota bacterium]
MLRLSDFNYDLPGELIAQYPLKERDTARLLLLDRLKGEIRHCIFKDLPKYLNKDDLIVLNDTKVLRARLKGSRLTSGKVEVLLLGRKEGLTFKALIKPSRVRIGERVLFNGGSVSGLVSAKNEITFNAKDADTVYSLGSMPLPPYIKRDPLDTDDIYYQTVYANEEGAIASPTAGLHFTKELLDNIKFSGTDVAYITLHVGYATFRPVKADDISQHKMEPEYFKISESARSLIDKARSGKSRVFAVGTTSLRALEAYAGGIQEGHTDLFIYPGYKFKIADCLLTNFHLPRTTLFMLVCAFAGEELAKKAYQEAIDKKYRFYSYGDAMLII